MSEALKDQVAACIEELADHGAEPATVALYDALYGLKQALDSDALGSIPPAARILSEALEMEPPLALDARAILAELSASGLWVPRESGTVLEEVYRTVGADPADPDAALALRDWVHGQGASRRVLERRLSALQFRVRRTELFANVAVVAAILLGVALVLSVFVDGSSEVGDASADGRANSEEGSE